ncbi:hypothetical protein [uncultured Tessaracoccus sp.]|uniref:hypothetical protein n=1 Tax=uncultured Tessaracoccus sp. TaxID=905023 RepID=UPI002613C2D1|nr:hypothetical protein [uncultured Tessaracoccus sp.]
MSDVKPEWVEKGARAAFDDGFMRYAPKHVARWDDDEHDEGIRESWRVIAYAVLAAVAGDIRAEAWDEGFDTGSAHGIAYQVGDDDALPCPRGANPYREQDGAES